VADVDIEALGLLDGLEGDARAERAQLIAWLLERGFSIDHIRASVAAPLMLPAYRVLGDDGELVSAREVCESTGVELELLQRLQRAVGLPCIEDPDAAVLLRAEREDAESAKGLP
jgi:adenylate cyclase